MLGDDGPFKNNEIPPDIYIYIYIHNYKIHENNNTIIINLINIRIYIK